MPVRTDLLAPPAGPPGDARATEPGAPRSHRPPRLGDGRCGRPGPPDGPASLAISQHGAELRSEAWGPGAERALAMIPTLLRLAEPPEPLPDAHPTVTHLARRFPGLRIPRTGAVLESLVPAILEQKVIGDEARRALFELVRRHGEAAPGPPELGLRLPPAPATLAALPYYAFHPLGVERRRAELIRKVAARPAWFEAIVDLPLDVAYARLTAVSGIGPWTAAEVGDPGARRPRRGERRRLQPAQPRDVRAGRRAARDRRPDAGTARAVPRAAGAGHPAARAERDPRPAPWPAPLLPRDRRNLSGPLHSDSAAPGDR